MFKETDEETELKLQNCSMQIMEIFVENKIMVSQAAGMMGSIMGILCAKTEKNFPFISFFNSFTRTYHENYEGDETHEVSGILQPWKNKKDSGDS